MIVLDKTVCDTKLQVTEDALEIDNAFPDLDDRAIARHILEMLHCGDALRIALQIDAEKDIIFMINEHN
jgi:hypothetical protein